MIKRSTNAQIIIALFFISEILLQLQYTAAKAKTGTYVKAISSESNDFQRPMQTFRNILIFYMHQRSRRDQISAGLLPEV